MKKKIYNLLNAITLMVAVVAMFGGMFLAGMVEVPVLKTLYFIIMVMGMLMVRMVGINAK